MSLSEADAIETTVCCQPHFDVLGFLSLSFTEVCLCYSLVTSDCCQSLECFRDGFYGDLLLNVFVRFQILYYN